MARKLTEAKAIGYTVWRGGGSEDMVALLSVFMDSEVQKGLDELLRQGKLKLEWLDEKNLQKLQ